MIALHPLAWAAAAAVLAMGGAFAWTWIILETLEVAEPDCPSREARKARLVVTTVAMAGSLIGASWAWGMSQSAPAVVTSGAYSKPSVDEVANRTWTPVGGLA